MRDLYNYIILILFNEEVRLLNALHQAEDNMHKYDYDPMTLLTYLKRRIEYRYFKDFIVKVMDNFKYYDGL